MSQPAPEAGARARDRGDAKKIEKSTEIREEYFSCDATASPPIVDILPPPQFSSASSSTFKAPTPPVVRSRRFIRFDPPSPPVKRSLFVEYAERKKLQDRYTIRLKKRAPAAPSPPPPPPPPPADVTPEPERRPRPLRIKLPILSDKKRADDPRPPSRARSAKKARRRQSWAADPAAVASADFRQDMSREYYEAWLDTTVRSLCSSNDVESVLNDTRMRCAPPPPPRAVRHAKPLTDQRLIGKITVRR